jgi:hypothetical protein
MQSNRGFLCTRKWNWSFHKRYEFFWPGERRLVQILCFWTLSIALSLSKNTVLFIFQNITFRRLDSVSVFRWNPFIWTNSMEIESSSIDWVQLSKFYLKTEAESSLRNVVWWKINRRVYLDKDRAMDNVQKHNICTNIPSSQILDLTEILLASCEGPCCT